MPILCNEITERQPGTGKRWQMTTDEHNTVILVKLLTFFQILFKGNLPSARCYLVCKLHDNRS